MDCAALTDIAPASVMAPCSITASMESEALMTNGKLPQPRCRVVEYDTLNSSILRSAILPCAGSALMSSIVHCALLYITIYHHE